jgi:hypothetical protein
MSNLADTILAELGHEFLSLKCSAVKFVVVAEDTYIIEYDWVAFVIRSD